MDHLLADGPPTLAGKRRRRRWSQTRRGPHASSYSFISKAQQDLGVIQSLQEEVMQSVTADACSSLVVYLCDCSYQGKGGFQKAWRFKSRSISVSSRLYKEDMSLFASYDCQCMFGWWSYTWRSTTSSMNESQVYCKEL